MSNTKAMTRRPAGAMEMVDSADGARARLTRLQAFIKESMEVDVDYGPVPGQKVEKDKQTKKSIIRPDTRLCLYKPGAEKLAELYGLAMSFEQVEAIQDWDKGFFVFRMRCRLTHRETGMFVGDGLGSCNSKEDKYAWRWVSEKEVPVADRGKYQRKEFPSSYPGGGTYSKYRLPNPDTFSLANTIEKMACKRAMIAAVVAATRSSGLFTQDTEDLPEWAFTERDRPDNVVEMPVAPPALPAVSGAGYRDRLAKARDVNELYAIAGEMRTVTFAPAEKAELLSYFAERKRALGGQQKVGA